MILFALFSAQETAKVAKTKTLIAKLDAIVKARWDSYRTRRVPIVIPPLATPQAAATMRLDALRDLMRMELPDRWSDIIDLPVTPFGSPPFIARPALNQGYLRKYKLVNNANINFPTGQFAGAECLYMIVMSAIAEEGDAREVFKPDDVKDVDGDGFPEFVDAWGRPIQFLRWPAGFQFSELQIAATGQASGSMSITVTGVGLSSAAGSYLGGALIQGPIPPLIPNQPSMFDTTKMARIGGYQYSPPSATITTLTSPPPTFDNNSVVMYPDPFDPSGVYAASATPSFAIYPLIYSGGPDKCYGIMADSSSMSPLHYANSPTNLNPFVIITEAVTPSTVTSLMGTARNDDKEENYVPSAWLDNIHNHMLGTK